MDNRFARIELMIGPAGLKKLHRSLVTVVGLGAVGGYATEALARSGVGRFRLVDFDVVHPTNINRQLYALESTLGQPKTDCARARILDINPECQVEIRQTFVHAETLDRVLAGPPDMVIDAIDAVGPKIELIAACLQRNIPLISSMGAALRSDPTAVRVGPLSQTAHCPLARCIRKKLRRRGLSLVFPCVYSLEPIGDLRAQAILDPSADNPDYYQRGRPRRTLGSLPTLTGIFGLTIANRVISELVPSKYPSHLGD